ncbi:protein-serine/threonine phosphatase [Citrus sinensis]|uniref:Protein-serine/threonine phosphatase n=1 Tax=Citrus sinensis TaxID=2711 RepID=A0ACB8LP62_CITSI|nr:protein-serine/threonine phosphatase [Citrus sinensis]
MWNIVDGLVNRKKMRAAYDHHRAPGGILVAGGTEEEDRKGRSMTFGSLSHGFISVIGRRRVMEDAVTVAIGGIDSYDFFAVYDGHGGANTTAACRERLHLIVAQEVKERRKREGCGGGWEDLMAACFLKMDEEVTGAGRDASSVGPSALVVMVDEEELVVANRGNSRIVLCRAGVAVPLSRDHKPDKPDESERVRVEAAGGGITNWYGCRVLGVLTTSASIGDQNLKPYVVLSKPEVTVNARSELDEFIVIATRGLWDVVSNEFACEVVRRCLTGQLRLRFPEECSGSGPSGAAEAATMLAELALARGSKHNISVIVVELKKSSTIVS